MFCFRSKLGKVVLGIPSAVQTYGLQKWLSLKELYSCRGLTQDLKCRNQGIRGRNLNQNQYKTFSYSSDLPISIGFSTRTSVRLPLHSSQCSRRTSQTAVPRQWWEIDRKRKFDKVQNDDWCTEEPSPLNPDARLAFTRLSQAFSRNTDPSSWWAQFSVGAVFGGRDSLNNGLSSRHGKWSC